VHGEGTMNEGDARSLSTLQSLTVKKLLRRTASGFWGIAQDCAAIPRFVSVPPSRRRHLRPLFDGWPYMHTAVEAVLEGTMGWAWAEKRRPPRVVVLKNVYHFIGGDPHAAVVQKFPRLLPHGWCGIMVPPGDWQDAVQKTFGESMSPYSRVTFGATSFDPKWLRNLWEGLPPAFSIRRIDASNVGSFGSIARTLVFNYQNEDRFLRDGIGFGVEFEGKMVAGASSFAIAGGCCEIEIDTLPDFRRRRLAAAAAARLIVHCLENGLQPQWDAANPPSAMLAQKLGFTRPQEYLAFMRQGSFG
jgi:RimJ/RimL family protein N-acetyltransferase